MLQSEPSVRKFVVGESLSRQVCRALVATVTVTSSSLNQHAHDTGVLVSKLVRSDVASFSSRHRSRLLKALVTAQDKDLFFPSLDILLESHAWDQMQVVVQRLSNMESLQPDSRKIIVEAWGSDVNTLRRLTRFVLRCTGSSSHTMMAGRMVKAASETYPRGNGVTETVVDGTCDVRTILDSYIRIVASVYATIKPRELALDVEIFESFMRMVTADASRSIASALSQRLNEQLMDMLADDSDSEIELELDIDEILVSSGGDADITLEVHRADILSSSFSAVMAFSDEDWQACETLDVHYSGEIGVGEGVARDWIGEVSTLVFYQSGLFSPCPDDPAVVHPNMELVDDNETFSMMEFAGRILGIARRLAIPTGVHLSSAAVFMITLKPLDVLTLAQLDPQLATSCAAIRKMEEEDVDLGTFVSPALGCELFPGGSLVPVTTVLERKAFANLLAERHIRGRDLCCAKACYWIAHGLLYVLAADAEAEYCDTFAQIQLMNADSFNAIFGGLGHGHLINAGDWRKHTDITTLVVIVNEEEGSDMEYESEIESECEYSVSDTGPSPSSSSSSSDHDLVSDCQTSRFLFQIIEEMNPEERRNLLRFWIGSYSLPFGGFCGLAGRLRLVVMPDSGIRGRLPNSHTCARTLVLPFHNSVADLRSSLQFCLVSMGFNEI